MFKKKNLQSKTGMLKRRGFSLIEAMVAVAVLSVSVALPLVIAERSLATAREAKNQIVAYYLAQDAVEYIRSLREASVLQKKNWQSEFSNCVNKGSGSVKKCMIDTSLTNKNNQLDICNESGGNCPNLRFEGWFSDAGNFGYDSGWTPSIFNREIVITESSSNKDEVKVTVTVKWRSVPLPEKSFTIEENLLNI